MWASSHKLFFSSSSRFAYVRPRSRRVWPQRHRWRRKSSRLAHRHRFVTANSTSDHWYILQPQSVWTFVNPVDKYLSDEKLLEAINASSTFLNCASSTRKHLEGRLGPEHFDPTVKAVVGVAVSLAVICFTFLSSFA